MQPPNQAPASNPPPLPNDSVSIAAANPAADPIASPLPDPIGATPSPPSGSAASHSLAEMTPPSAESLPRAAGQAIMLRSASDNPQWTITGTKAFTPPQNASDASEPVGLQLTIVPNAATQHAAGPAGAAQDYLPSAEGGEGGAAESGASSRGSSQERGGGIGGEAPASPGVESGMAGDAVGRPKFPGLESSSGGASEGRLEAGVAAPWAGPTQENPVAAGPDSSTVTVQNPGPVAAPAAGWGDNGGWALDPSLSVAIKQLIGVGAPADDGFDVGDAATDQDTLMRQALPLGPGGVDAGAAAGGPAAGPADVFSSWGYQSFVAKRTGDAGGRADDTGGKDAGGQGLGGLLPPYWDTDQRTADSLNDLEDEDAVIAAEISRLWPDQIFPTPFTPPLATSGDDATDLQMARPEKAAPAAGTTKRVVKEPEAKQHRAPPLDDTTTHSPDTSAAPTVAETVPTEVVAARVADAKAGPVAVEGTPVGVVAAGPAAAVAGPSSGASTGAAGHAQVAAGPAAAVAGPFSGASAGAAEHAQVAAGPAAVSAGHVPGASPAGRSTAARQPPRSGSAAAAPKGAAPAGKPAAGGRTRPAVPVKRAAAAGPGGAPQAQAVRRAPGPKGARTGGTLVCHPLVYNRCNLLWVHR